MIPSLRATWDALGDLRAEAAPATLLAQVQGCWTSAVGTAIAAEAEPVAERDGELVVACRSGVWASELELLAPELLDKINAAVAGPGEGPFRRLRAKVSKPG